MALLTLHSRCAFRDARTTLLFVRFVERMRRAIAHEYGLALSSVLPGQTFVARFDGEQDQQAQLLSLRAAPLAWQCRPLERRRQTGARAESQADLPAISCHLLPSRQGGLHSDESTHREFHYSCVFYLASQVSSK
jgi:hypothetical protein